MMVYSKTLLSKKIGKVVFDVKCSDNLEKIILDMGGTPIRSRTGHSYIKKSLIKNNALLAGEMSGHIFFNDGWYGFDDGIFAAITLLEIVSKEKNPKKLLIGSQLRFLRQKLILNLEKMNILTFSNYLLN